MARRNEVKGIIVGIILLFLAHVVAFYLVFGLLYLLTIINFSITNQFLNYLTTGYRFLYLFFYPGLTQLIYVLPACYWLKRKERIALMKGVIIGAVITALLNGGCWLLLMPK